METSALTQLPEWIDLQRHFQSLSKISLQTLFKEDPSRGDRFSISEAGLYIDYSKNRINSETIRLLCQLAAAKQLDSHIEDLLSGKQLTTAAAGHPLLRQSDLTSLYPKILGNIHASWDRLKHFSERIRDGSYRGYSDKPIQTLVNVGIGGSHLGPQMIYHALKHTTDRALRCFFISNQDEAACDAVLQEVDPETTLFIFTSKSFTTQETVDNAARIQRWVTRYISDESWLNHHCVAVTAYPERAKRWGLSEETIFPLWEWVCGRFSVWSSVSVSVVIALGWECFNEFLSGASRMDHHFRHARVENNMPVILGLLGIWYTNFCNTHTQAIIPYSQRLLYLPNYLKQLFMESQGKNVQRNGRPVNYHTGVIVWGGVGTDSQHSFHQLLLQGTATVCTDFILPLKDHGIQLPLIANCLSQAQTLMCGYTESEIQADLKHQGLPDSSMSLLIPHKTIRGNNPSNTILMESLTPYHLGALLALYEHKVYVQSVVWNINAFDQWGVESCKNRIPSVLKELQQGHITGRWDSSTAALLKHIMAVNNTEERS